MHNCTIAHISNFLPLAASYFLLSNSLAKSKLSKEIIFFPDRDLQMFADYFVECPLAKENSAEGAILSAISSEKVSQYLSSHKFCICYFPVSKFDLLTCAQQTSLEPPHPGNKNRSREIEILQMKASCFCLFFEGRVTYRYRKSSKRPLTPAPHVPKIKYIAFFFRKSPIYMI